MKRTLLLTSALLLVLLVSCGGDTSDDSPRNAAVPTEFEVIPDYLDPAYENPDAGIAVRPPLNWTPLAPEQRDAVAQALIAERDGEAFGLEIIDIFLQTDTLSFLAISWVVDDDGRTVERDEYVEQLWETIEQSGDDELRGRTTMLINDLVVEQFRHTLGERVTFTLVTTGRDEQVMQLDYSIPLAAYEREGIKLESSIGTLRSVAPEGAEE
jgi:hypothetical protein